MSGPLAGQVALVTGGGRGIGRAIALALASAGAAVAVVARSMNQVSETTQMVSTAGGRALALSADVTDQPSVERMVHEVQAAFGPIALLVNCAGSHDAIGLPWEIDAGAWWHEVESNLRGPFLCIRAVLPEMVARRRGRIVNVASGAALEPRAASSAYASAKTALLRLTESIAIATAEHGIPIFAIHPGGVRTALTERIMASEEGQRSYPHWQTLDWQPPERAAALVVLLASGRADALSGRYLDATQDIETLIARAAEIRERDLLTLRLKT